MSGIPPVAPVAPVVAVAVVAEGVVDYETLVFPGKEAFVASGCATLKDSEHAHEFYVVNEYPPPSWCNALTVVAATERLKGLCLYALRKESDARKVDEAKARIIGPPSQPTGYENTVAEYWRGQAILARAAKRWLSDLV